MCNVGDLSWADSMYGCMPAPHLLISIGNAGQKYTNAKTQTNIKTKAPQTPIYEKIVRTHFIFDTFQCLCFVKENQNYTTFNLLLCEDIMKLGFTFVIPFWSEIIKFNRRNFSNIKLIS